MTQTTHPIAGVIVPVTCPQGYYCLNATERGTEYGCPNGTYGDRTGLSSPDDCVQCDGGMYCGSTGLSAPTGPCDPGFYCDLGASKSNPEDGVTGNICPQGYYCPQNTTSPLQCSAGTFGGSQGIVYLASLIYHCIFAYGEGGA